MGEDVTTLILKIISFTLKIAGVNSTNIVHVAFVPIDLSCSLVIECVA